MGLDNYSTYDFECEGPEAYVLIKRRARKLHKCVECRGAILATETYVIHSGIWDGRPSQYKVCIDCYELSKALPNFALGSMKYALRKPEEKEKFESIKNIRQAMLPGLPTTNL